VGQRFCAAPGSDAYGAVSVKVAYWAQADIAGMVPATVFLPRPKVESALVRIVRRTTPAVADIAPDQIFPLVRAAFAKRRKMLRSALAGVVTVEQMEVAGIDPTARAEQLDINDWGRLAHVVALPS
jgi:16S rRNA (adenine1518-N6/adenine1519-N6)-dimethyltransferase